LPSAPDYEGTIAQVREAQRNDRALNSLGGAFYNTAWFYDGYRVTHTWQYDCIADNNDINATEYDWGKREYGYTWVPGFEVGSPGQAEKGRVKIRVRVCETATMGLTTLAEVSGIKRDTLYQAARCGRLEVVSHRPYLSTLEMVNEYQEQMTPKPRK